MVLFSATMPSEIRNIAKKYLNDPAEILIKSIKKETQLISQKFLYVQRHHKLDALKRILELNNEGVIIFVRTKLLTTSIAEALENSGHTVAVLNLSLIHISEPTRHLRISYAVFCFKKKSIDTC